MAASSNIIGRSATVPNSEAYRQRMRELVGKIARAIGGEAGDAGRRAWTMVALMVGAVSVARALPDGPAGQTILDAALQRAIAVIDGR